MKVSVRKNEKSSSVPESIFQPGQNCWRVENASYASPVIDCSNYYRAIHQAICNAQETLFIVGWDIDSRIELLRGKEAEKSGCPNTLFELLKWKSEVTPNLKMYLNRWDYSIFLAAERETFASMKWKLNDIKNLAFIFDDQLPLGASHHQKIIVVDDEIAFCGGMDIAIARWDNRQHHVYEHERKDPKGTILLGIEKEYRPYHDVQMLVAGDAAKSLGELARKRWYLATGQKAKPLDSKTIDKKIDKLPESWPKSIDPFLQNVSVGISLTMPRFRQQKLDRGIENLYIAMIEKAESFIYMENQFFTHCGIARALNKRLKENPQLRVLLLSCKDPQGFMERKTMYYGRVRFKDALLKDGLAERVVLAYPISQEDGSREQVRIHSKVMIVDDSYLRIGSSNINYRSMTLDTECDLVIEGTTKKIRDGIGAIRNDLIREHTGRTTADIEDIITNGKSVKDFLKDIRSSRQHIREINDEDYRHERLAKFFIRFGDPSKPLLPSYLTSHRRVVKKAKNQSVQIPAKLIATITIVILLISIWQFTPLSEYANAERIVGILEDVRNTPWAFPAGIVAYTIGTLIFVPHIIMTTAVVIAFSPVEAFVIAISGSLISCSISYVLGLLLGKESLKAIFGGYTDKISHYADKGGVMGLTVLRMIPTAPFTAENLILGMIKVPYITLMISTLLGMLPGTLIFVFLGKSAIELFKNPDPTTFMITFAGVIAWVGLIWLTHHLTTKWKKKIPG